VSDIENAQCWVCKYGIQVGRCSEAKNKITVLNVYIKNKNHMNNMDSKMGLLKLLEFQEVHFAWRG
jgi:hypothetical protein